MTHITRRANTRRYAGSAGNSRRPTAGDRCRYRCYRRPLAAGYSLQRVAFPCVWLLVAFVTIPGCSPKPNLSAARPARSEAECGPVRVTAEVQPSKASLSDELTLTLTIDYQQGVAVTKPPFGSTLGGFDIRDVRELLPTISNGRETIRQIYTLDPTDTGTLRIDPISVAFTDRRRNGDGHAHTVQTEPLSLEITSLVGSTVASLDNLRPPAGPLEVLSRVSPWLWGLLAVGVAAMAAAWWFWRRRRREKAAAAVILSPEEIANLGLDQLVASGLADRDIKQFYVELTNIVRRYIERTTGVCAPEQTTEEFLREISRTHTFGRDECGRLRDFLESADLVKFAAHRPRAADVAESIRRARIFIELRLSGRNAIPPTTNDETTLR